ncbi:unnamed protein product, partial [Choristocarpus tenellus]
TPSRAASTSRPNPKKKARKPRPSRPKKSTGVSNPVRKRRKVKTPRPPDVPLGEGGREKAMGVLRALVENPLSDEFHKPVTELHPELTERYTSVVRRPIDLHTVARRLRRGTYDNACDRLYRDISRIFSNCELFNKDSSQIFVSIARYLQDLFECLWAEARLPVVGSSPAVVARKCSALRAVRYRLCWGTVLRGPLLSAARSAIAAAGKAAALGGGP